MAGDMSLWIAAVAMAGGSATLRWTWSLPSRSAAFNGVGWALYAIGAVLGWVAGGAWGVATVSLFGMGAALLCLAVAGLTAPAGSPFKASNRRVGALPGPGERWHLGRRVATFLLIVLAAAIVSVGIALAVRGIVTLLGGKEADALVAGLFALPVAWALLGYALLMEERRMRQWRLLTLWALPGVVATVAGLAA